MLSSSSFRFLALTALLAVGLLCVTVALSPSVYAEDGVPAASSTDPVLELSAASSSDPVQEVAVATSTDGTGGQVGGTIVTGDATASTTIDNELNSNVTNNVDEPGETNSSTITASTTNDAELTSQSTTTASTGENQASGGESLASIDTGNAVSTANVINQVNTNIFNSEGLILFLNLLFGGGFDLREHDLSFFFGAPSNGECTLLTCLNSSEFNVINTNTATVTNAVSVNAATGQNIATSTGDGGAEIATGDAYAAANVLNLVNTNLINARYLLLALNNFGDMNGHIIFPAADFFTSLLSHGGVLPDLNSSTYDVQANNSVGFTGTTTATAETGMNIASSTLDTSTTTATTTASGSGEITTGDAFAAANTFTQANSTQIGGTSIFFLFRVFGNWTGEVLGLPQGLVATTTPLGLLLVSDVGADTNRLIGEYNSSAFLATSTNTAVVENNVDVTATTGENTALTEHGTSTVETGDAYAVANVLNLINTNVVGGNWLFAIFNIFGDWNGHVSFGDIPGPNALEEIDEVVVVVPTGGGGGGGPVGLFNAFPTNSAPPQVSIEKTTGVQTTSAPASIDYKVVVFNEKNAGSVSNAVLTDTLYDPSGVAIFTNSWDLQTLAPGDQITLTYTIQYAASTTPGTYRNVSRVTGTVGGQAMKPVEEAVSVVISGNGTTPQIPNTGSEASASCSVLLTTHLRPGRGNNASDVSKLQAFLAKDPSVYPQGLVTGFFGPMTTAAVRAFQLKHAAEILAPLGLTRPTGLVYGSTLRKINELHCGGMTVQTTTSATTNVTITTLTQEVERLTERLRSLRAERGL